MSAISNCKLCTHWSIDLEQPQRIGDPIPGFCRRYPPSVFVVHVPNGFQLRTQFPQPTSEFWCGEFAPRGTN